MVSPIFNLARGSIVFFVSQLSEVIIFALIYWALETYDPGKNYNGIDCDKDDSWCSQAIKFFYYSLCIQSTIGYGDITPKSEKARLLNMAQIILVYVGIAATTLLPGV